MFYLGIDVGKNTHVASLMNDDAKIIFKAFSFPNTLDAAEELLHKLKPYQDSIEIGMEATGHYWLSLYSFLIEHNFTVHVVRHYLQMIDNIREHISRKFHLQMVNDIHFFSI